MKKIRILFVIALVMIIPFVISNVQADTKKENKKINVYLFRGDGCPHCAEAEEWFKELAKDEEYSKYYKLVDYEVWYDEDNSKLMSKVAEELETEANGVPFIVVGKKYFSGFSESMEGDIKSAIKDAYEGKDYKDVVSKLVKGTNKKETNQKSIIIPVIIISIVAVGVVIGMVFLTKEK